MPLTEKGRKVKKAMEHAYGKDKGKKIFYATENKGKVKELIKKKKKKNKMADSPFIGGRSSSTK